MKKYEDWLYWNYHWIAAFVVFILVWGIIIIQMMISPHEKCNKCNNQHKCSKHINNCNKMYNDNTIMYNEAIEYNNLSKREEAIECINY